MNPDIYPQPRKQPPKPMLPPAGTPWFVRPFYSRGNYSPRLNMAWVFALALLWLLWRWMQLKPEVVNGVLVPVRDIDGPMGILAGLISSLILYGTYQKVKLGDTSPSQGEIDASHDQP